MPDIWGLAAIASKFLIYLGGLTAAGTLFACVVFRLSGLRAFAAFFAVLGLIGALVNFALAGALLTGDASGMADSEMLGLLWSTPAGDALAYRAGGLVLLIAGLFFGDRGLWVSALGGVLALWSFATVGHVFDHGGLWLDALLLFHLIAVAIWIGILGVDSGKGQDRITS